MKPASFLDSLIRSGFGPFTGVPCSLLGGLIEELDSSPDIQYYAASSEGESMGIAAGFSLAKKIPVVLLQNDGFGNIVNPISSLQLPFQLPTLLVITWRGDPDGPKDAVQHELMGKYLLDLLNIFQIPYSILDESSSNIDSLLLEAKNYIASKSNPYALIIKKNYFDKVKITHKSNSQLETRETYTRMLIDSIPSDSPVLGTTGFTGRELCEIATEDTPHFYMPGSMGCLPSIGLGLAKSNPSRQVFVLDGDGALLMKMGTLATIGHYKPENLVHILYDNQCYESTGCQNTTASTVDFVSLASSCQYASTFSIDSTSQFKQFLDSIVNVKGPVFCHVKVSTGTLKSLNRPEETPIEHKNSFTGKFNAT